MLKISSNQTRITITVGATILVVGLLFYLGVFPMLGKVRGIQDQILYNRERLVTLTTRINDYKSATAKYSKIEDNVAEVTNLFPLREDSVILVESMERAVLESGVTAALTIVDQTDDTTSGKSDEKKKLINNLTGINEIPYNLHVTGSYEQITTLFLYLENMPFFTQVSRVSVSAESKISQNGKTETHSGLANGDVQGVFFLRQP